MHYKLPDLLQKLGSKPRKMEGKDLPVISMFLICCQLQVLSLHTPPENSNLQSGFIGSNLVLKTRLLRVRLGLVSLNDAKWRNELKNSKGLWYGTKPPSVDWCR